MRDKSITNGFCFVLIFLSFLYAKSSRSQTSLDDLFTMSFSDLLNLEITTASGINESVNEAPATIIIIDREKLIENGYQDLLQVLTDLPGMDVIISNGDTPFSNYWRGYRNDIGAPYILMIDGVNFNHLYYNFTSVLVTLPLSNIQHIEVIYGPSSSVYGANAFMGVINIVTRKFKAKSGNMINGHITMGSHDTEIADLNTQYRSGDFGISMTARLQTRNNMPDFHNSYEWTKSKYLVDKSLWGPFTDHPSTGGEKSIAEHKAIDMRAFFGNTELALQYYQLINGTSMVYPFDKNLPNTRWHEVDKSVYVRHTLDLSPQIKSKTLLRYRQSNVPNKTYSLSRYSILGEDDQVLNAPTLEYWQLLNSSWEFEQNFNYQVNAKFDIYSGINYELKDLHKAYDYTSSSYIMTDSSSFDQYEFPVPPPAALQYTNRIITKDRGIYLQSKYRLTSSHIFHVGIRHDHNSTYKHFTTLRSGYHYKHPHLNFKLLYGEGFNEPSARVLYGGWAGTGSDPELVPEESKTIESSIDYQQGPWYQLLSIYKVFNRNTILNYQGGARNAGERDIYGLDFHLKFEPQITKRILFKSWLYYSYIHATGYELYNQLTDTYSVGDIGDIAPHKVHFGFTSIVDNKVTINLCGRYISRRNTVQTNPIDHVNDYWVMDAHLSVQDLWLKGIRLSVKINNIFNKEYFHPGMRDANAGNSPGYYGEHGEWIGSQGWYNSLLPQMGREFFVSIGIDSGLLSNSQAN